MWGVELTEAVGTCYPRSLVAVHAVLQHAPCGLDDYPADTGLCYLLFTITLRERNQLPTRCPDTPGEGWAVLLAMMGVTLCWLAMSPAALACTLTAHSPPRLHECKMFIHKCNYGRAQPIIANEKPKHQQ